MTKSPRPASMGPVGYLLLTNALFWGGLFGGEWLLVTVAGLREPQQQQLVETFAGPVLLEATPQALAGSPSPAITAATAADPTGAIAPLADEPMPQLVRSPSLLEQLQGADGLGGPVTLASLEEPAMPAAARAEQLAWQRSGDALSPLPMHWRQAIRQEIPADKTVKRAAVVRLPVASLQERVEVAVLIDESGTAMGLADPQQQPVRQAVEAWAQRQAPASPGEIHAVVIAAEPLPAASAQAAVIPTP